MPPAIEQFRAGHIRNVSDSIVFEEVDGRMMASVRIITAGTSKNRRNYPPAMVKDAADKHMFNGVQMFIDHDRKNPEPQSRSLREMVSAIESTSWDEGSKSLDARVQFFDRNFYEKAQVAKDYLGVSINAVVKGNRRVVGGQVYEDLKEWVRPRTVDWVTTPAAGGAILAFEDEDDTQMIDWSQVTLDALKENRKEVYEAILAEVEPDPKPDLNPPAKAPTASEIAALVTQGVQEAIAAQHKSEKELEERKSEASKHVKAAFEASGLPIRVRSRVMGAFEGVEAFDEQAVTAAITEAKEELESLGVGPRITGMGPSSTGGSGGTPSENFSVHESVKSAFGVTPAKTNSDDPKGGTK